MARRRRAEKREIIPDPKYNSIHVTRFINAMMKNGKKSIAEKIFYGALEILEKQTGEPALTAFKTALNNAKPIVEVKSRRIGGATYQVPVDIRPERRNALAIRWLIQYSRARTEKNMTNKLAAELLAAYRKEGATIKSGKIRIGWLKLIKRFQITVDGNSLMR